MATRSTLLLGALALFQAGWIAGQLAPVAHADPLPAEPPEALHHAGLYCKPFPVQLEGASSAFDTTDRTTAIGRWIAEQEGYTLASVDFELGRKPTGYPLAYVQVCLAPLGAR